jgi:rare lipoprotein A
MKRTLTFVAIMACTLSTLFAATGTTIETGIASWYTSSNSESLTANGEVFDPNGLTAAHKTLKFGSLVRVTNNTNGKSVEVKINDRGPFVEGRVIDLTPKAAKEIGMLETGIANVTLSLVFEPDVPESKYSRAGDTGWYLLQVGAFSSPVTALAQYERISQAGLRPAAELLDGGLVRLSVRWVPAYQLSKAMKTLQSLGFEESKVLKKSEDNPYL